MEGTIFQDIFLSAKQKVTEDFNSFKVKKRLHSIKLRVVDSATMQHSLQQDYYRKQLSVPAYYNPNSHTVFLNSSALAEVSDKTVFIICYHELIHATSLHMSYRLPNISIFQSGVKFERYSENHYKCFNRLLNEGMVQFLTTCNNNVNYRLYAYAHEVSIVITLVDTLGFETIKNALLFEQYSQFKLKFEERYGQNSFIRFAHKLDHQYYSEARKIVATDPATVRFQTNQLAVS